MSKTVTKRKAKRYVIQTYTSWMEPQYQTHIANGPQDLKEITGNSDRVEAVYLLGQEITYAKRRKQNLRTANSTIASFDDYENSNERLAALL